MFRRIISFPSAEFRFLPIFFVIFTFAAEVVVGGIEEAVSFAEFGLLELIFNYTLFLLLLFVGFGGLVFEVVRF